jgi:hypothetical protein
MLEQFNSPKVYKLIRSTHPYAYKSGQWGAITGTSVVNGRACYDVLWTDGARDQWPVLDDDADYEFMPYTP